MPAPVATVGTLVITPFAKPIAEDVWKSAKEAAWRHKHSALLFLADAPTIIETYNLTKNAEYKLYEKFLSLPYQKPCILTGLFLRRHAKDAKLKDVVRKKVLDEHEAVGLHLMEAAQAELLPLIQTGFTRLSKDSEKTHQLIVTAFADIDSVVRFIDRKADEEYVKTAVVDVLDQRVPAIYIVAGSGPEAVACVREVHRIVRASLHHHKITVIDEEDKPMYSIVFYRA